MPFCFQLESEWVRNKQYVGLTLLALFEKKISFIIWKIFKEEGSEGSAVKMHYRHTFENYYFQIHGETPTSLQKKSHLYIYMK